MDELEFRRRVLTEPSIRDGEIIEATRTNENNAKFLDDVLTLDKKIAQAMSVDVPDDLADRILLNQAVTENNVVKPTFTRRMMSMAASVAFVAGLLAGQVNWGNVVVPEAQASLASIAMDHVYEEKPFTSPLNENASIEQLNVKLMPFDFQFEGDFPYHVYYLNHCTFGTTNALHAVFEGEKGRVTMFVTNMTSHETPSFSDDKMEGMIVPVKEATMIIVGNKGEDVAKIAENIEYILKPM